MQKRALIKFSLKRAKAITGAHAERARINHSAMVHIKAVVLLLLILKQRKAKSIIFADVNTLQTNHFATDRITSLRIRKYFKILKPLQDRGPA